MPYIFFLVAAVAIHQVLATVQYNPREGVLSPTFWPMLALAILVLASVVRLGSIAITETRIPIHGGSDVVRKTKGDWSAFVRVAVCAAIMLLYGVSIPYLGFVLSSSLFMIAFMLGAGSRRIFAIVLTSLCTMVLAAFLFLRIAYVSLPRGVPPFDSVTDMARWIVGG